MIKDKSPRLKAAGGKRGPALFLALLLALVSACGSPSADLDDGGQGQEVKGVAMQEPDFGGLTSPYGPEEGYDEYTLIEYSIEDAGVTFVATVSRKSDASAYYVHGDYLGDEQAAELDGDFNVTYDMTGFLEDDAELIARKAIESGVWVKAG